MKKKKELLLYKEGGEKKIGKVLYPKTDTGEGKDKHHPFFTGAM